MRHCNEACDLNVCGLCIEGNGSLLSGVDQETANLVGDMRVGLLFKRGEQIPSFVDETEGFHILRNGKVKVSFDAPESKAIRIDGPGSFIGYGSWLYPGHRAEALEDVFTCFFSHLAFSEIAHRTPVLTRNLIAGLCRSIARSSRRIAGLADCLVKRRVASVLAELAHDFGVPSKHGSRIGMRIDRRLLAELSGTVSETLSRALTDLEKDGVIVREKWDIHIVDPNQAINQSCE